MGTTTPQKHLDPNLNVLFLLGEKDLWGNLWKTQLSLSSPLPPWAGG